MGGPIQVSPVLRLHAPTRGGIAACRALLQLSSRAILQTALAFSGRLVVSVWRLVNTLRCCVVVVCLCMVSFELRVVRLVHPSLRIRVGAGLHLFLDSVFYVAEFC